MSSIRGILGRFTDQLFFPATLPFTTGRAGDRAGQLSFDGARASAALIDRLAPDSPFLNGEDVRGAAVEREARTAGLRSRVKKTAIRRRGQPPPVYNPADLRRIYGREAYSELDQWVNLVARGEGRFGTVVDLGDGGGLSVGILQWTQASQRLGRLMQKYRDVSAREGRLEEFERIFGGPENAAAILATLRRNPSHLPARALRPAFIVAGRHDLFQQAQIEVAREDVRGYIKLVAPLIPYRKADGSLPAQLLAAALIVKNIGGAPENPLFVRRAMERTTTALYEELARKDERTEKRLRETIARLEVGLARRPPRERERLVARAVAQFKRARVVEHYSERAFLRRFIKVAPRMLYRTPWKYARYHRGVENRLREATTRFSTGARVRPARLAI